MGRIVLTVNNRLLYVVEVLLKEANPDGVYFGKTTFYKLMFLLTERLLARGIDINLPYSWYRYGTMIERQEFFEATGIPLIHYAPHEGSTIQIETISDRDLPLHERQVIVEETRKLLSEFPENDYLENRNRDRYIDIIYERAPLLFQKLYSRNFLKDIKNFRNVPRVMTYVKRITFEKYLDDLLSVYPVKEMEDLYDTYLEWDDTFRLALDNNPFVLDPLATDFWNIFCRLLRAKYNGNISEGLILDWTTRFHEEDLPDYQQRLAAARKELLEMHTKTTPPDSDVERITGKMMKLSYNLALEERIPSGR
jgi:hypothetical protein